MSGILTAAKNLIKEINLFPQRIETLFYKAIVVCIYFIHDIYIYKDLKVA